MAVVCLIAAAGLVCLGPCLFEWVGKVGRNSERGRRNEQKGEEGGVVLL